jgi:hypothetical protein
MKISKSHIPMMFFTSLESNLESLLLQSFIFYLIFCYYMDVIE